MCLLDVQRTSSTFSAKPVDSYRSGHFGFVLAEINMSVADLSHECVGWIVVYHLSVLRWPYKGLISSGSSLQQRYAPRVFQKSKRSI
jgi:hypothetical protein